MYGTSATAQVHPHHSFMPNGSWQFRNFSTPRMEGDTFLAAFDLHWYDYLNPITPIMYLAGRDMADGGNCFGMVALAAEGERSRGTVSTRFSGRLTENFWSNYPTRNGHLDQDINTYHWRQLSSRFVTRWLVGIVESAQRNAERAGRDIEQGTYGLLCINMNGRGHALVPIQVGGTSENIDVVCYDPNLPLDETRPNTLVINRSTGNWRYHRAWSPSAGWHDTWTGGTTGISYVSYDGGPGWKNLLNDPLDLVFGQDTTVKQITDQNGRKLFKRAPPRGLEDVDFSENGLGSDVVRWIPITQQAAGSRRDATASQAQVDSRFAALSKAMTNRYASDYGDASEIYFVLNDRLILHIDMESRGQQKELRMAAGHPLGTTEYVLVPERPGTSIQARATIQVRNPATNIVLASTSRAALSASVIFANLDDAKQQVTFETAAKLPITTGSTTTVSRMPQGSFRIEGRGLQGRTEIVREVIGQDARLRKLAPVSVQLGPQPEPPDRARTVPPPAKKR
jgi:hypothetical protein